MIAESLEGALVTLERVIGNKAKEKALHDRLNGERLQEAIAVTSQPSLDEVRQDLADESLWVYEVVPHGREAVAYVGVVRYDGSPYLFVHFYDESGSDLDLTQDAATLVLHEFFRRTDDSELWVYYDLPVPREVHNLLVEAGFDFWDRNIEGHDFTKSVVYVLERETYHAYYDEESEDDSAEELDF